MKRADLALSAAALLLCALTILATYPGTASFDSVAQWEQALSGNYSDWHPPIMAWLWAQLWPATLGPRGFFVLQMVLYWGAFLAMAFALKAHRGWVLALALLPVTLNFSFVLWKDVWMAIMLAFAAAGALHAVDAKRRWPFLLFAWLALAAALLFRANALFAAFPLAWLLLLIGAENAGGRIWIKLLVTGLLAVPACLLLLLTAQHALSALTQPEKTWPSQFIMVDDLFWLSDDRNLLPAYVGADPTQLKAGVQRCRDTALYLCPDLRFDKWITRSKGEYNQLRRAWRQAILDDPQAYVARRWQTFRLLLRSPAQDPYEILQINFYQPNPQALRWAPNALGQALVGYVRLSSRVAPDLFKPYAWLLLGAGVMTLALFRRRALGPHWPIPLALAGSGLLYILGYALASQAADFRYIYWSIWAILFALIACFKRAPR